nr:unnamed protein product [Callosobruchus chinensis]
MVLILFLYEEPSMKLSATHWRSWGEQCKAQIAFRESMRQNSTPKDLRKCGQDYTTPILENFGFLFLANYLATDEDSMDY